MTGEQTTEHWWLDQGEQILVHAATVTVYQYVGSPVRRRFPANFFVTDRRLVAASRRGRLARKQVLPIDVPREHIRSVTVAKDFKTSTSYYRPFPPKRVLRLDIDHQGRDLAMGVVLSRSIVDTWADALGGADDAPPAPQSDR